MCTYKLSGGVFSKFSSSKTISFAKLGDQLFQCLAAMRHGLFLLAGQLSSCQRLAGNQKNRVVTKTGSTSGDRQNLTVPVCGRNQRSRIIRRLQRYQRAIEVSTPVCFRQPTQLI